MRIIEKVRAAGIDAPFIGFPKGAGTLVANYVAKVPVQAVAMDVQASGAFGRQLQETTAIQGALDPLLLRAGGAALDRRVEEMLVQWGGGPYIFNLGHGILPDTPIAHVEQVLARVVGS
jgi:uroporphyrinogen decarboxylase